MGYYTDNSCAYEGHEALLTLRQLIAGEGGNATHEAIFTYLMGYTYGPQYRDRRAGQMFLLVTSPLMRILGAWDSYQWERSYTTTAGVLDDPLPPFEIVSMLNAVDGVQLSPYMLSLVSQGVTERDVRLLDINSLMGTQEWSTYKEVADTDDRSLCLQYLTRELGYSSTAGVLVHNVVIENTYN